MRIALDAMGGDYAPRETVLGALSAAESRSEHTFLLIGDRAAIEAELAANAGARPSNIEIIHASQAVAMDEKPVDAIRKKPDSSILVGMKMVAAKQADAIVSAGNTGAMVAAATICLRPLPGVRRVGIAISFPSAHGRCTVMDVGANLNCKPVHLCQYGVMGSIYHRALYNVESPRVGMLNVGEEDSKGGPTIQEAAGLLAQAPIRFVGMAEGRDIFRGEHDVVVCDGFTGNALLKAIEGYGELLTGILGASISDDAWGRLSSNLMKPAMEKLRHITDFAEYGGGLLMGVDGGVVICHGRSNARAIHTALQMTLDLVAHDVNGSIVEAFRNMPNPATPEK